ncbi:DUF4129 domain-containing protein [Chitinophaga sp. NPDC101104]|uniref:DUF4129 domain-containing protein n=1 Tax=Chitinophaga sp. NPDC101104 TaxID=3390561 RepID=UPI003CFD7A08
MNQLKTVLLILLLTAGGNALAQRADTLEYRMLDSTDSDNIPSVAEASQDVDIDTTGLVEEELSESDMNTEEKMRHGMINHSLYDRQPIDGFDEGAQMRLTPRVPPAGALQKLRDDESLKYPPYNPRKDRRPQWMKDLGQWAAGNIRLLRNLMLGALGLLIIVAIVLFMSKNDIPVFRWGSRRKPAESDVAEEIGQTDLEALALAARNAGQLREAVRFRYLHALHLLENVGLITRTKDKTNMDYLRELGRTSYYQPFAAITLQYEYVWYGKMSLSEAQYGRVNEAFEDFKNSLTK